MALPLPVSGNYPAYSSDHASKLTPKVYAKKLLIKFYDATVFGEIAHRDYEGEIKAMGDTVIIRTRPDIVVSNYTRNMSLNAARKFYEPSAVELVIDKAKFFSIGLDKIDETQFDINVLDQWAEDGSNSMAIAIDQDVLANIYGQAATGNYGTTAGTKSGSYNLGTSGSPVVLTKANVLDYIAHAASVLSEQAVPQTERWMVLPEVIANRINTSDLRSALFTGDQSNAVLRNGRMGEIANFRIYTSNNLTAITGSGATAVWPIIFGHKSSLAFASQLTENRIIDLQDTFGKAMDSLQVYGYKVCNPKYLGYIAAQAG